MTWPVWAAWPRCETCGRPLVAHGNQRKHWRPCGPLTGAAAGSMDGVAPDELARYVAAMDGEAR